MKPLRTPDLQRKRRQQQPEQQQGRGLSLKQQIEQQHQQQLVPWSSSQSCSISNLRYSPLSSSSSRQLYGPAATPPSPCSEGGTSSDVIPFETVAQQLLQSGGPVRRLRFSASRQSKSLVVAKLPDRIRFLKQPISITKDVPVLPPDTEAHAIAAAAAAAPWRLRDSSDVQQQPEQQQQQQEEAGSSTPSIPTRRPQQKTFVTRQNEVDASCFFLLVESQGVLDVLPVAEWLTFERTLGTQQPSPEELEQRSKAQASLEAALTQRAAGLRRASDSDEESRKPKASGVATNSLFDDELGLERRKKKRLKGFLKERNQGKGGNNEYIDSALSIGNLRQEAVTWDFEEGERSDDEAGEAPQDGKENSTEALEAEPVESESENDAEDPLTSFGQKMKSLLDKAREDEADAELHQYESEDEEDEGTEEKVQEAAAEGTPSTGGASSDVGQRSTSTISLRGPQGALPQQQTPAVGAPSQAGGTRETLEAKVVRVMQQHMGRMAVKDFMNAFKVKQKNEEFKRIQAVVHKVCKMEATEDKQKFIVLKPEFRL